MNEKRKTIFREIIRNRLCSHPFGRHHRCRPGELSALPAVRNVAREPRFAGFVANFWDFYSLENCRSFGPGANEDHPGSVFRVRSDRIDHHFCS